jgi:GNAT superfamily N-acetyltransferase
MSSPAADVGRARAGGTIRPATQPGDLGWVVQAHGELYAREHGWTTEFEALVAGIVGDFARGHDPAREAAWVAEVEGHRAGCIACTARDDETAALRVLLVDPSARGRGLGAGLVDTCVRFARDAGYRRMTLWTTRGLDAARHLYEEAGFRLVQEDPRRRMFGRDLVGQTWVLDL